MDGGQDNLTGTELLSSSENQSENQSKNSNNSFSDEDNSLDESEETSENSLSDDNDPEKDVIGKQNADLISSANFDENNYSLDKLIVIYKTAYSYSLRSFYEMFQSIRKETDRVNIENKRLNVLNNKLMDVHLNSKDIISELQEVNERHKIEYEKMLIKYEDEQKNHTKTLKELNELKQSEFFSNRSASVIASLQISIENGKLKTVELVDSFDKTKDDALEIAVLEKTVDESNKKYQKLLDEKNALVLLNSSQLVNVTEKHHDEILNLTSMLSLAQSKVVDLEKKLSLVSSLPQQPIQTLHQKLDRPDKQSLKSDFHLSQNGSKGLEKSTNITQVVPLNTPITPTQPNETKFEKKTFVISPKPLIPPKHRPTPSFSEVTKLSRESLNLMQSTNSTQIAPITPFELPILKKGKSYKYNKRSAIYKSKEVINTVMTCADDFYVLKECEKGSELLKMTKGKTDVTVEKSESLMECCGYRDGVVLYRDGDVLVYSGYFSRILSREKVFGFNGFIASAVDVYYLCEKGHVKKVGVASQDVGEVSMDELGFDRRMYGNYIFSIKNQRIVRSSIKSKEVIEEKGSEGVSCYTLCEDNIFVSMPRVSQIGVMDLSLKRIKSFPVNFTPVKMESSGKYVVCVGKGNYSIFDKQGNNFYNVTIPISIIDGIAFGRMRKKVDCRIFIVSLKEVFEFGTKLKSHEMGVSFNPGECVVCKELSMDIECIRCHKKYHNKCFLHTVSEVEPCCAVDDC
ncbi:hypothetical protein EIN_399970 [Entamoeba invadens IP1]|uniref:Uncharacterized protein n=1 Tax=Entamoeba invadens IP1 TaxID=370355 RepID=A0A0A1UA90_ENTIV|nr:hypothetical protein EIN_399970 [Entamoeba invadens IP1]ELP91937.1 hypothetical protein EIN_399970 [Entamoeba invadens IP1]|eukprot:XP_004258708.1 hypothetical protein EIN_399970 [Entamoeba invadens IP1]